LPRAKVRSDCIFRWILGDSRSATFRILTL
jgi:hypothetical protein